MKEKERERERERERWGGGWRNYMGIFALFLLSLWSHTALGPSPNFIFFNVKKNFF